MRNVLIALGIAVMLTECGAAHEVTVPPATLTPLHTPTVAPTPTATPAATAGLGITRAALQAQFERAPLRFAFADSSSANGPAVKGSLSDIAVELRGPPDNVEEAQVQVTTTGTNSADALRAMVTLLSATVPSIDDPATWLQPHLDKALKQKTDVAIEGDRMITLIATPEIKYLLLSVRPAP